MEESANIGVAVRVRPLLKRESGRHTSLIVLMPGDGKVVLLSPDSKPPKKFQFDDAIWSFDDSNNNYTDNSMFYHKQGPVLVEHLFRGFNVCLLAYGQTGSGKTYTMMGEKDDLGVIPMLVKDVLNYKAKLVNEKINCVIKVSYMEVYNETVRDLLYRGKDKKWKVRENPETGPYVDGLREVTIEKYEDFIGVWEAGNRSRATAATSMNSASSRSHAILNLHLKQTKFQDNGDTLGKVDTEVVSSIKLVDLAGSERLAKTQVYGQQDRVKEGSLINKSLTVLGRCINVLSKNTMTGSSDMIPYRDSILTYILKENLGGNSKTVMIFCVSPVDFDETLQTLNYATRVKNIKTTAKANLHKLADVKMDWSDTHQASVVETLREQITTLTEQLKDTQLRDKDTDTMTKMVEYLEKELNNAKFEIKFMTNKLQQHEEEMLELKSHNRYLTQTLLQTVETSSVSLTSQHKTHINQSRVSLNQQLERHALELAVFSQTFLPANIF